ncbi:MAG: hypothetical protein PHS64_06135, partial [Candidatus Omnitrophica bacterium]|nr:hypothetical protein [Candidatus Omnitrophota bacterium]
PIKIILYFRRNKQAGQAAFLCFAFLALFALPDSRIKNRAPVEHAAVIPGKNPLFDKGEYLQQ